MTSETLRIIHAEHMALSAMLSTMTMLVAARHHAGAPPEFGVLRAMLFYVDEYPEQQHHPKESDLLFPRLRLRAPELAGVLDRLDRDHAAGERKIRELEHALLAFEVLGEARREVFEQALDAYVKGYLDHMAIEESQVLPAAERLLTAADWAELDAAFAANRDPLTGHPVPDAYAPLFTAIVNRLPAPFGLGPEAAGAPPS